LRIAKSGSASITSKLPRTVSSRSKRLSASEPAAGAPARAGELRFFTTNLTNEKMDAVLEKLPAESERSLMPELVFAS